MTVADGQGKSPWRERRLHARARRALARQLDYQQRKAAQMAGRAPEVVAAMVAAVARTRGLLASVQPIPRDGRVLEVGSGAHGLIFYFGTRFGVGIDPLAHEYAGLFPAWQRRVTTLSACGESLPFRDGSFDIVLSDNVVDHAERPADILREIARVLAPSGLLYFTVNFHHPVYACASAVHAAWNTMGVPLEIGPFADHTVHLTLKRARGLLAGLPLRVVREATYIDEARQAAAQRALRHPGDLLKRLFFKNALYEAIAVRE